MPGKQPAHKCLWPGCGKKTLSRYCEQHTKITHEKAVKAARERKRKAGKKTDGGRQSAWRRGYNKKWRNYRLVYLTDNPWCARCDGLVSADVVDHIKPHKGDMELFWDESNLQSLCKSCHDLKTSKEDGGHGWRKQKK